MTKALKYTCQTVSLATSAWSNLIFTSKGRKKAKDIPADLRDQWNRDHAKKAARKQLRAQARLEQAADPLIRKKGGKKGRKATLAAAALDPTIQLPNQVVDMISLEQQIRRFLADIGGRTTMALPPMQKDARKRVHDLAMAFNLKSQSKGKNDMRYTTLIKTTKSGFVVDEKKVWWIVGRERMNIPRGPVRPKDGEVIGKVYFNDLLSEI